MTGCALVVGATSTMGKAIVRRLVFSGYKVAISGEDQESVGQIVHDNKKVGGDVTAYAVDVRKAESREKLFDEVEERMGGFDALVVAPPTNAVVGDILSTSSMQFDKVFGDYLTVPFHVAQHAVPRLSKSKNGSVLFMTSCVGYTPSIDMGMFAVAANSVLALTKAFAKAAASHNVRVNSLVCGMVEGDGSGAFWDEISKEEQSQKMRQQLEAMIPLGRLGRPSDAASLAEFLLSPKARYITGENCLLGGGVSYRL